MKFCIAYVRNTEKLPLNEIRETVETRWFTNELNDDVLHDTFEYVPYGDDYIMLAEVNRSGGDWHPVKSMHIWIEKKEGKTEKFLRE